MNAQNVMIYTVMMDTNVENFSNLGDVRNTIKTKNLKKNNINNKIIVLCCHDCGDTVKVENKTEEERVFLKKHFHHGKFTAFEPYSEDGRRHAIMAGIPYSIVNYYAVPENYHKDSKNFKG